MSEHLWPDGAASGQLQLIAAAERLASWPLVILRGLPGSGKSTLAFVLAERHGHLHLEADQHFQTPAGYRFDPERLADAHAATLRSAWLALEAGRAVVLANTHVRLWELAGAIGLASLASVAPIIVECVGCWPDRHGVPEETLSKMARHWQTLPATLPCAVGRWDGQRLEVQGPAPISPPG